ncbi:MULTISPECIES: NAD-binding protein [Sulfurimonas]|uniref:NAD-binding protein n=1 Tax=Sulfurimonas TaxID=202746 RepID=UPI0012646F48|nr:NAD-binding protein [Sulfurimonas indica]
MAKTTALIFGYNKYAHEIMANVVDKYKHVKIYSLHEEDVEKSDGRVEIFDLSDEWLEIRKDVDIENSMAFCLLEENAQNIFLTISLRANFENLTIIAVASNNESANKLKMAGANKVIPIVETTSDIITNMLEKPISSKILHSILYEESELKIAQIKIDKESHFKDEQLTSIDWTRYNGIIVLSVMHKDMKSEFIYSSKAKHHIIQEGDILVVVGYEADIAEFEKKIGSKRYVNWSHWSW